MYRLALLVVVTGCGFEVASGPAGSDGPAPEIDARLPDDAGPVADAVTPDAPVVVPDAMPDMPPPHVCNGYAALPGSGTQSTYRVYAAMNWANAKARCETDTAYLTIPETTTEARAVYGLVDPDSDSPFYWGGLRRMGQGVVDVLDRTSANPPWGAAQPNNGPMDPILIDSDGLYYDYMATASQQFACECAPTGS